ncbi:uncharacterized protein LOC142176621 [Nicotiana tabacum]|uniref:Uncharacterized protein LOC142176621 n=1 Tax=Nicotiana tabacum TaxID=4097 RepID=A0AC58TU61_TOBAC
MEPLQKKKFLDKYRRRLGMEAAISNVNGKIWLFFDSVVEWDLLIDTEQQMTIRVYHQDLGKYIMMTFVYAKCCALERLELWDNLYYLASDMELPWLIGSNFNVVLGQEEKIGGLPVYPLEYEYFAFCVNSCGLFDLGYKGSPFTWWNGRPNKECIFKRLVEHLIRTGSDHAPLLMSCGKEAKKFVKPLKFLNFWAKHETFLDVSKLTYRDIFKQLAIREDVVRIKEMLFEDDTSLENRIVLQQAQAELKKYLSIEEQYWKQKADQDKLSEAVVDFFQKQFTKEGDPTSFDLLNNVPTMVTREQNLELCRLPTMEKIKAVVFALSSESASGPDGYSGLFFQPKKPQVQTFSDLRPISLSNFINKGRNIFENILLTQEIVTDIRLRGKPANVVIKLDMVKTYDRVSWKYLMHVLRRIGFAECFINMVWNLIVNNWYSVMVNGEAYGFFHSTRGVKQGDPLSPALFILSAEVLSRSLNKLFEDRQFRGFGMPKWFDPLNHLAYVDDTIIFASANPYSL